MSERDNLRPLCRIEPEALAVLTDLAKEEDLCDVGPGAALCRLTYWPQPQREALDRHLPSTKVFRVSRRTGKVLLPRRGMSMFVTAFAQAAVARVLEAAGVRCPTKYYRPLALRGLERALSALAADFDPAPAGQPITTSPQR
jgi:hypothetical protein